MTQDDVDWTDEDRMALQPYGANVTPSEMLLQRTVNALREQHLIERRRRRARMIRPAVGIAAAIAIIATAANYLLDPSDDNENVVSSTASTTKIERHVIWF